MRTTILILSFLISLLGVKAQSGDQHDNSESNMVALKTNLIQWATLTLNVGAEVKIADKLSFDLPLSYNPWAFSSNTQYRHFMIQPELRYWLNKAFNKSFIGLHGSYINYDLKGMSFPFGPYPATETNRFDGTAFGFGFTYGYQFYASQKWNLEASIGLGYARHKYDEYNSENNYAYFRTVKKNHFGVSKIGFSVSYFIQ